MGSVTFDELPNVSGVMWLKKFSDVSVRITKIDVTVVTDRATVVNFHYGNTPDAYGRLDYPFGKIVMTTEQEWPPPPGTSWLIPGKVGDFEMSAIINNTQSGKGIYFAAGAASGTLKHILVTITYEEPAALAGTLRVQTADQVGKSLAGVPVGCAPVATGESGSKTTGADGFTSFQVPIGQTINYNASMSGYMSSSATATISDAGVVQTKVLVLTAVAGPVPTPPTGVTGGNLEVTVKDASGAMVEAAMVTLGGGVTMTQGPSLPVRFNNITPGTYSVVASKVGYTSASGSATIVSGQTASLTLYLVASAVPAPSVSFSIRVRDSGGNPVPSAAVSLGTNTRSTDDSGFVSFTLPAGTYPIYISLPQTGLAPYNATLNVSTAISGQTVDVNMAASALLPADVQQFAISHGIPFKDIPAETTDIILITFASPIDLKGYTVADVYSRLSEQIHSKYPGANIWGVKLYSNNTQLAVFSSGGPQEAVTTLGGQRVSLVIPVIIYYVVLAVIALLGIIFGVTIPAILSWDSTKGNQEIVKANQDKISEILADPTLTADQKAALIEAIIKAGGITPPATGGAGLMGYVAPIVVLVVAGVGGYAAYKIISKSGKK